jgi:hypothetical protein
MTFRLVQSAQGRVSDARVRGAVPAATINGLIRLPVEAAVPSEVTEIGNERVD